MHKIVNLFLFLRSNYYYNNRVFYPWPVGGEGRGNKNIFSSATGTVVMAFMCIILPQCANLSRKDVAL